MFLVAMGHAHDRGPLERLDVEPMRPTVRSAEWVEQKLALGALDPQRGPAVVGNRGHKPKSLRGSQSTISGNAMQVASPTSCMATNGTTPRIKSCMRMCGGTMAFM